MKVVVITGSTRGIGYGLADAFLARGCGVAVCGRSAAAVEKAVAALSAKHDRERVFGQPCDVADFPQVQVLWDATATRFGRIDIWINNAGISHAQMDFWEHTPERIRAVVETNVVGAMYGARVALRAMVDQGFGSLYNMEGLGSGGARVSGLALYASTKASLRFLTDAWAEEVEDTPVLVGALQPGMVITDLVTGPYAERPEDLERAKRIFNILADRVETVAPWLVQRVLQNEKNGARIRWLNRGKVAGRFLLAPFRNRDLFA
jgi:NAD(P)-dependent dehydrogenase (short-subunit alcohol dehydrogenase family)